VISLIGMLAGMRVKSRIIVVISTGVLLINGGIQSVQFLTAIPRWIYLGLAGITLVSLGGMFEYQRETLGEMKQQFLKTWERWN